MVPYYKRIYRLHTFQTSPLLSFSSKSKIYKNFLYSCLHLFCCPYSYINIRLVKGVKGNFIVLFPACYRLRLQVKLVFKRLKSLLQLGNIPTKTKESGEVWINGKIPTQRSCSIRCSLTTPHSHSGMAGRTARAGHILPTHSRDSGNTG